MISRRPRAQTSGGPTTATGVRSGDGIAVERAQRRTYTFPGPIDVVVDRDVDALGDRNVTRVSGSFPQRCSHDHDLLGELRSGGRPGSEEPVGVANGTSQGRRMTRTEPDRRVRPLERLGFHAHALRCQKRPSKSTVGSVHNARISRSPSLNRPTNDSGSTPKAENIRKRPPVPRPTSTRPCSADRAKRCSWPGEPDCAAN